MKLEPLYDFVCIEAHDVDTSQRGIVIPDRVRENRTAQTGRVVAIGPGRIAESGTRMTVDVEVGDIVLFQKNAGIAVDADYASVRMVRSCELLGRLVEQRIVEVQS